MVTSAYISAHKGPQMYQINMQSEMNDIVSFFLGQIKAKCSFRILGYTVKTEVQIQAAISGFSGTKGVKWWFETGACS